MIQKKMILFLFSVLFLTIVGCNSENTSDAGKYNREISDSANVAAIMQGQDVKDTAIIGAILDDRSTITVNDIDTADKSYTTRSKTLYHTGPDGKKLAVVYGYKAEGKGMAVMQKVGEKPIVLQEKEMDGDVRVYSNGKITLQKSGTFAFVDGIQYEEVR